jgi:hypothetical protein
MTEAAHQQAGRKKNRKPKLRGGDVDAARLSALATELRAQALEIKRDTLTTSSTYGVVIETAYADRVTSLVVLTDGSASWYANTGQGCIGCGRDAEVRLAAQQFITRAMPLQTYCRHTEDRLQPLCDRVRIFFLSNDGLLSIDESLDTASRAVSSQAPPHVELLVAAYTDAQRLLQLIERRGAGTSLEDEVVTLLAETPRAEMSLAQELPNTQTSEKKACLSVGNAVRRLRT